MQLDILIIPYILPFSPYLNFFSDLLRDSWLDDVLLVLQADVVNCFLNRYVLFQIGTYCEDYTPCPTGTYCIDTCQCPGYQCIECSPGYHFKYELQCTGKKSCGTVSTI